MNPLIFRALLVGLLSAAGYGIGTLIKGRARQGDNSTPPKNSAKVARDTQGGEPGEVTDRSIQHPNRIGDVDTLGDGSQAENPERIDIDHTDDDGVTDTVPNTETITETED